MSELGNDSRSACFRLPSVDGGESGANGSSHVDRSGVCVDGTAELYRVLSITGTVTRAIPGLSIVGGG
jgi:hypothetical protein